MNRSKGAQLGFACPEESFDGGYLASITRARSTRLSELFVKCFSGTLGARASGLAEILAAFRADPGGFPGCWPTALGAMRGCLIEHATTEAESARAVVADLALELAASGRAVRFTLELGEPRAFRFAHWLLPETTRLELESDGTSARLVVGSEVRTLTRAGDDWAGDGASVERVGRTLLIPMALPDGLVASSQPDVATYAGVYALIGAHASAYLTWVERVVRIVVPVESRAGATTSSSFELSPGVVALSASSPVICLADALVHEASHQHFYLVTQAGRVDDGSDTELYYSPAPRKHRPIDKILLAYHAFANVLLFYRACRESGFDDPELCLRRERHYADSLAVLDAPLRASRALTPLGRALYEPLAERIAAHLPATVPQAPAAVHSAPAV